MNPNSDTVTEIIFWKINEFFSVSLSLCIKAVNLELKKHKKNKFI